VRHGHGTQAKAPVKDARKVVYIVPAKLASRNYVKQNYLQELNIGLQHSG